MTPTDNGSVLSKFPTHIARPTGTDTSLLCRNIATLGPTDQLLALTEDRSAVGANQGWLTFEQISTET